MYSYGGYAAEHALLYTIIPDALTRWRHSKTFLTSSCSGSVVA